VEIYFCLDRNLRGSKKKFTGIKEEFYGDQRENLRGSRKNFTGIEEKNKQCKTSSFLRHYRIYGISRPDGVPASSGREIHRVQFRFYLRGIV
jgi:hypothetical protein